jgi:beta-mannosidase
VWGVGLTCVGPAEVTAGPWKDIRLELFNARIDNLYVSTKLAGDLKNAMVTVETTIEGEGTVLDVIIQQLWTTVHQMSKTVQLQPDQKTVKVEFEVADPKLWWPAGHGDQPLYIALAKLSTEVRNNYISGTSVFSLFLV